MVLRINSGNRNIFKIEAIEIGDQLFKMLWILADEEWHTTTELCQRVYGIENPTKEDAIAVRSSINRLRNKNIEIVSVRSKGYRIGLHTLVD